MITNFLVVDATTPTMEVAKGIHEYGIAVIICSVFIVLSVALMITCFRWFRSIIESIMNNYSNQIQKLYEVSNKNGEILVDIAEGLVSETILRVQIIANAIFDVSFYRCIGIVSRVKEENNISNKEATQKKVQGLVQNQFDEIVTKFENFNFKGKSLTAYLRDNDWEESVVKVIINEIYQEVNPDRTYTNLKMVYENIKLEFHHNINNVKKHKV